MTKEVSILNTKGSAVGQIALDEKVFGVEPNLHVMHLALRRQLNNGRAGSALKQEQKYLAAAENPGNKKVQVEQEPVLFVHHYLQAAALSLDQNPETTVLQCPKKQEDSLLNQLCQLESTTQFWLKISLKSMNLKLS